MAVQYYVASSLDGFIAAPHDDLGWLLQFGMTEFSDHFDAFLSNVGAIIMGSSTYEFILREGDDAWSYGMTPTWVLTSRELPTIEHADIRFTATAIEEIVGDARDAAGHQNVWVVGGGDVAAQIADARLLDEMHVTLMPIVLGSGTRLLPVTTPTPPLQLLRSTQFDLGAVELVYTLHGAG